MIRYHERYQKQKKRARLSELVNGHIQRRLDTVRMASWLVVLANHERSFIVVMKSTWRASRKK